MDLIFFWLELYKIQICKRKKDFYKNVNLIFMLQNIKFYRKVRTKMFARIQKIQCCSWRLISNEEIIIFKYFKYSKNLAFQDSSTWSILLSWTHSMARGVPSMMNFASFKLKKRTIMDTHIEYFKSSLFWNLHYLILNTYTGLCQIISRSSRWPPKSLARRGPFFLSLLSAGVYRVQASHTAATEDMVDDRVSPLCNNCSSSS